MKSWSIADIPDQTGKHVIITGATGGLGFETALELARKDADVVLAARNPAKGADALARIRAQVPNAKVRFELLDLASLESVRAFADRMLAALPRLDILVNNAAVMSLPRRQTTADGFEMQIGTNYLSHFALTLRLLPLLRAAQRPRVVNLSSLAHRGGKIDLEDFQGERYKPWKAYQQSKLAMLMFAIELQRRSDANGWRLMSNAAHPGYARTDLIPNGPGDKGPFALMSRVLGTVLSHSAAEGALPQLLAATSPDARPSAYYGPDGFYELKGPPAPARIMPQARDAAMAAKLWALSEKLTGVSASQALSSGI